MSGRQSSHNSGTKAEVMIETKGVTSNSAAGNRTDSYKQLFRLLLEGCLADAGLPMPQDVETVQRALDTIPSGISPSLSLLSTAVI